MTVVEKPKVRVEWVPTSEVWVALATFTREVRVKYGASTEPLKGGPMAIFSRPVAEFEEVNTAEVLGVFFSEADAEGAVESHRSANEALHAEYSVKLFPLSRRPVRAEEPAVPVVSPCIMCGVALNDGTSYCQPCRAKRFAQLREMDPGE